MKYKPLEKPKLVGCMNCSGVPTTTLNRDRKIHVFGMVTIYFDTGIEDQWDDFSKTTIDLTKLTKKDDGFTIREIEDMHIQRITNSESVCIDINGMMHGETYELNKDDNEWYLVDQNRGLA